MAARTRTRRKHGETQDLLPIDATIWKCLLDTVRWVSAQELSMRTEISPLEVRVMLACWERAGLLDIWRDGGISLYRIARGNLAAALYSYQVLS